MAGTDALTGARYPGSADSPNVNQDIQNAVNDLSDIVGGIFTTNSARDTAFSTWVSQGNTLRDGLTSRVAGEYQIYKSGAWHGVTQKFYGTTAPLDTTTVFTSAQTVMSVSVPDPAWPAGYRLIINAAVLFGQLGVGVTASGRVRVNGTDLLSGVDVPNGSGTTYAAGAVTTNFLLATVPTAISGTLTGASTVTLWINKVGTAGNGFQISNNPLYNTLAVQVVPA